MSNILTHSIKLASGPQKIDISVTDNDPFFRVSKSVTLEIESDNRLTQSAKRLYSKIYTYYLGCGSKRVWVSQKTLARDLSLCVRTIQNATKMLVKYGYLAVEVNDDTRTYNYYLKATEEKFR